VWAPGGGLVVVDRLTGDGSHAAASFIHLAPGVEWDGLSAGPLEIQPLGAGSAPMVVSGRYAPFIGTAVPASVLSREWRATPGDLSGWSLLRPGFSASLRGDRLSLAGPATTVLELQVA
jgi:hypothetical protein